MSLPVFRTFDEAVRVQIGETTTTRCLALADDTQGRLGVFHHRMLPGAGGADPHYHTRINESFYIISGQASLYDGSDWRTADPGDFLNVPQRAVHGFRNITDEPVDMLIVFTPAENREEYFRELACLVGGKCPPTREDMVALMARYDQFEVTK